MESIDIWKSRINRANTMQSQQHGEWEKALELLDCRYVTRGLTDVTERVDVHFGNWYVNNLVPLVYFKDPFIFIKSKTDGYSRFAETQEKVVNTLWKDLKLKQQFKRVILSAFLMPPGWIHLGYTAKIEEDVAKMEENKEKSMVKSLKEIITGVFKEKKEEKLPEEKGVMNQFIKEESIFATFIPSWNVLMPEGYHLVSNMPWIAYWEDVPVIDFRSNPLYKNKDDIRGVIQSETSSEGRTLRKVSFEDPLPPDSVNDETTLVRLFHIWDRRTQSRGTLSMGCDKWHFQGDWPYDMEGFPLRELVFEETLPKKDKNSPYPYNIIRPILPQIEEQSKARTQMAKWRARASAIIACQKDMLSEEDMNQIEESDALQIIRVSDIKAIQMTQTPALPPEIFEVDAVIKQDLQMATNMGQLMFQAQKGQRTATQASIGQGGLQLKISSKQDCIEDFTVEVARCIAQLAWQFFDREKVKELIGEDVSDQMWPDLPQDKKERRRVIQNMKVFIDAGAASPPKDETVDKKQLLDFLQFAAAFAPERIKKDEALKAGIKRWKFVKDVDKIVITNDDEEIKAAQEENNLLAANMPCIVSPNNNHMLHMQEHAKAQPTTARDQHLLDHAKFSGFTPGAGVGGESGQRQAQQGAGPQEGDTGFPKQSLNPEAQRQGNPSGPSIMQSAQNKGPGSTSKNLVPAGA